VKSAEALENFSRALAEMGELEEALVLAQRASELTPEISSRHPHLAQLLEKAGKRNGGASGEA
jgi:hypothetical protein